MAIADDLGTSIAREEAKLAELERQLDETRRRLSELRIGCAQAEAVGPHHSSKDWSPERKVALFAELFRGREDVFPMRWQKRDGSRSGWAPRCSNEWKPRICEKPRVRCGECPSQAFVPLDDRQLLAHLQGRQVIGVYPLLADDTCRLLAIDLDGGSWREDVRALREVCRGCDLEPAIERSRSGNGAHAWFFFSEPVPAALARRFGLGLLTDAMSRSPSLGMASYDRLFPSQDTLPRGGFGNLIALPLQLEARGHGNTVFLDESLEPCEDQWSYLASVPRIEPERLEQLVARSEREGPVLGVGPESARDEAAPWRPARPLASRLPEASLPAAVRATLAQRLFVDRDGLPPPLLDAIRRIGCFSNPQFLERQAMRLSTARTPRVIACFEEVGRFLALPRGCREAFEELLSGLGVKIDVADERADGVELEARFTGELRPGQARAVEAMREHEFGVLCAPPGSGKTVIAAQLIAQRARSTLVLVHRKPLLDQWVERLSEFLDLEPEAIGVIGGDKRRPTGLLDVAMVQSLARSEATRELLADYGHLVVDECHHVPAVTTERVLRDAPVRHLTALTATPQRRDGHHPIIAMQCGSVRHRIEQQPAGEGRPLDLGVVRRDTEFDPATLPTEASIQEVFGTLAADRSRTELIAQDALDLLAEGRSPIVLTERREHLQRLQDQLIDSTPELIALHGEMSAKAERAGIDRLRTLPEGRPCLVLATGRYLGEGFDQPRLDTLLLAMPIAWKGTVTQYAGRLHRAHAAKRRARIYDYVDAEVPVLRRMFAKRLKAYRALGYELVATRSSL